MSRTATIMHNIRDRIAARTLTPGERLPSIRRFAATMSVSPSTVVEAYDRLVAEGVIRSRPGSGFFVADALAPLSLARTGPSLDRAIDPLWVSRQSLDAAAGSLKPGCGWLPADWMPEAALRRALRAMARAEDALLSDYGATLGAPGLRRHLARQMADQGLTVEADQILLTPSGTQAIDLICRFLLRPGDTVLVDDPCYFNFQALLKAHQARVIAVPYTPAGPDTAAFSRIMQAEAPRLYITNSALHNPTGATISPQVAHHVLTTTAANGTVIVEDDIFAAFEPEPSTRLAALDGLNRVIRIGSFSKSLSASVRCGYIAARRDWIEALVDLQVATNFGGPSPLATGLLEAVLTDGGFGRHMSGLHRRLAQARRQAADRLAPLGITPWVQPRGGFYLWCHLPEGVDGAAMARAALLEDVVLAPGDVFSPTRSMAGFMRFNVSQMDDSRLGDVLVRAMDTARRG